METVKIIWGSQSHRRRDPENNESHQYEFATPQEKEAFLKGVDESNGYMDYEVVEEDEEENNDGMEVSLLDDGTTIKPIL